MAKLQGKWDLSLVEPLENQDTALPTNVSTNSQTKKGQWNPELVEPLEEYTPQEETTKQAEPEQQLPKGMQGNIPGPTGLGGIASDIAGVPEKVLNYALDVPEEAEKSWKQAFTNPARALKNIAAGAGETAEETLYSPVTLGKYLAEKGIPGTQWTKKIPKIPNFGIEEAMGLNTSEPGDKLLRQMFAFAAPGKLLGKSSAVQKVGTKLEDLGGFQTNKKINKQIESKEQELLKHHENIENLGQLEDITKQELQSAEKIPEASKFLNKGAYHRTRASKSIEHRMENIEKYWKTSYKDLRENLKNNQFKMENIADYSNDIEHAIKNINDLERVNGRWIIKAKPEVSAELRNLIDKAPTAEDVSADTFLTKYQDFRDARYDMLQRSKDPKATAGERKAIFQAYEDSKPLEEQIKKALDEGLGKHQAEFQRINKGYSEQIYPLRGNKVIKAAIKDKIGPNTIEDLMGTGKEKGPGNALVRQMIKDDPELLRNILGQRYAAKPHLLHDIDEATAEYLREVPELKKILDENLATNQKLLEKTTKLAEQKKISLKEKVRLENERKELVERLDRIKSDRNKIWHRTKTVGKVAAGIYFGAPILQGLAKKYLGV